MLSYAEREELDRMTTSKEKIREEMLEKRSKMSEEEVRNKSKVIQRKALEHIEDGDIVFIYLSYRNELRTDWLVQKLISRGNTVCVPKVFGGEMKASEIEDLEGLKRNKTGIREPTELREVEKDSIDIAVVPGLAFDRDGNRIGYGEGYYDRFLEGFDDEKIGLTYRKMVRERVPNDYQDIPVDKIISEKEVI